MKMPNNLFNYTEFGWSDLGTGLFVYEGNILVNPELIGNLIIGKIIVVDFYKTTYLGKTWREVLIFLQSPLIKKSLRTQGIEFFIDLDDQDMCADGIMSLHTNRGQVEYPHFIGSSISTSVAFSRIQHKYIEDSVKFGKYLFK